MGNVQRGVSGYVERICRREGEQGKFAEKGMYRRFGCRPMSDLCHRHSPILVIPLVSVVSADIQRKAICLVMPHGGFVRESKGLQL